MGHFVVGIGVSRGHFELEPDSEDHAARLDSIGRRSEALRK